MVDSEKSWKEGQTLKIYDSAISSDAKDRFLDQLEKVVKNVDKSGVSSIVNEGVVKKKPSIDRIEIPYEHVAYADKGIPAITVQASSNTNT